MTPGTPGKIGFLGGTFNPIHNGHISAALNAIEKLNLDRVVFLPGSNPPHKTNDALLPFEVRYRLIEESIKPYPGLEVSDLDNTQGEKSYTWNLVKKLREHYPHNDFYFIIGEDNIGSLKSWYRYKELLDEITFAVVTRNTDESFDEKPDYFDRLIMLPMQPVDVSSTEIRRRMKEGENIAELVPKPVVEYLTPLCPPLSGGVRK